MARRDDDKASGIDGLTIGQIEAAKNARKNNSAAVAYFIECVTPYIDRRARRFFPHAEAREDAVQEVIYNLLNGGLKSFDPSGPIKGYLTTITNNQCRDLLKKKRGVNFTSAGFNHDKNGEKSDFSERFSDSKSSSLLEQFINEHDKDRVNQYINDAPDSPQKQAFMMTTVEGFTTLEVSKMLGKPESTIKMRKQKFMLELKDQFKFRD